MKAGCWKLTTGQMALQSLLHMPAFVPSNAVERKEPELNMKRCNAAT